MSFAPDLRECLHDEWMWTETDCENCGVIHTPADGCPTEPCTQCGADTICQPCWTCQHPADDR